MNYYQPKVIRENSTSGARLTGGRDCIEWLHRLPHGYVSDFNGVIFSFAYVLEIGEEITLYTFADRIVSTGNSYAADIVRDCADYARKKAERDRRHAAAVAEWEANQ